MQDTAIEWADHTWNPWIGCQKEHTGCVNCYAEHQMADRFHQVVWGAHGTRRLTSPHTWRQLHRWNVRAGIEGSRPRVFTASLADWFEPWDGAMHDHRNSQMFIERHAARGPRPYTMDDARRAAIQIMREADRLTFMILTKRPDQIERTLARLGASDLLDSPRFWFGASVSDQATLETYGGDLARLPARVKFLSIEPMVGKVDLFAGAARILGCHEGPPSSDGFYAHERNGPIHQETALSMIADWVIIGGESGPSARTCWLEDLHATMRQCQQARIPVFVKQLGSRAYINRNHPECNEKFDYTNATQDEREAFAERFGEYLEHIYRVDLKHPKGGDPAEWSDDLRIRELPTIAC